MIGRIIIFVVVIGIIGLVIGYFIFGRVGGGVDRRGGGALAAGVRR